MSIGLCGASGTGKTTLAKVVAKYAEMYFLESSARKALTLMGLDSQKNCDFNTRMAIQWKILELAEEDYKNAPKPFISDRTPLDFIAYTIADVSRETLNDEQREDFEDYYIKCFNVTNTYFSIVTLIQPAITIEEDGVRPTCSIYSEHINLILLGLMSNEEQAQFIAISMDRVVTDLKDRCRMIVSIMETYAQEELLNSAGASHH